jgi:hypothetical protein
MARLSQGLIAGLTQPGFQQGLFNLGDQIVEGRKRYQAEQDAEKMKGMNPVEQADFMLSKAVTPDQILAAQMAKRTALQGAGQESLAVLQQRMSEAQRKMAEFSSLGNQSRVEAAKAEMESLEEAMVAVSRQTGQTDMTQFIGEADRREAAVNQAEYDAINNQATVLGNRLKLAKASLQQYVYGSEDYKEQVKKLKAQGLQQAVDMAEQEHLELETARAEHIERIGRQPTAKEIQEMEANGIEVPKDPLGQKVAWRAYSKSKLEKEIEAATSGLDPVTSARAEGVVSFVLNRIASKGDYVDITSDDIASVIEDLTDEQKSEIADLITDKPEDQASALVEAWLRENYPEPFARSEAFAARQAAERAKEEEAVRIIFEANPPGVDEQGRKTGLDPNVAEDRQRALDEGRRVTQEERERPFRERRDREGFGR